MIDSGHWKMRLWEHDTNTEAEICSVEGFESGVPRMSLSQLMTSSGQDGRYQLPQDKGKTNGVR